jgi:hypothetical protein
MVGKEPGWEQVGGICVVSCIALGTTYGLVGAAGVSADPIVVVMPGALASLAMGWLGQSGHARRRCITGPVVLMLSCVLVQLVSLLSNPHTSAFWSGR